MVAHLLRLRNLNPREAFARVRSLGEGIYECRPPNDRVLLCFGPWPGSIVLLRAFSKQKKRTPKREIDEARKLKRIAEEISRRGGEPWLEIKIELP
jgi:phage-related protein